MSGQFGVSFSHQSNATDEAFRDPFAILGLGENTCGLFEGPACALTMAACPPVKDGIRAEVVVLLGWPKEGKADGEGDSGLALFACWGVIGELAPGDARRRSN